MKGSYILVIKLKENVTIFVGKLGKLFFKKGFYVYVGSGLNSLEARIIRHLRRNKNIFWHIDYLLKFSVIINVFYKEKSVKEECNIAQILNEKLIPIHGFGCSDCECNSHLFYGSYNEIKIIIKKLKMKQYPLNKNT